MRIQFLAPWGIYKAGDIADVSWTMGSNLNLAKYAKEVPEDIPVKVAAVEAPPRDKMLKRNMPHLKKKAGRPKGSKNKPKAQKNPTPIEVMTTHENQDV